MSKIVSAKTWLGQRVEARLDSGWGTTPGYIGIVCEDSRRTLDDGWFSFVPDNGEYPEGILAHTQEFFPPNTQSTRPGNNRAGYL